MGPGRLDLKPLFKEIEVVQSAIDFAVQVIVVGVENNADFDIIADELVKFEHLNVTVCRHSANRGGQIAQGIECAAHDLVWVLHADARQVAQSLQFLLGIEHDEAGKCWGRFDIAIPDVALVPLMMNVRSKITRICTGDQAMFFSKQLLESAGGFPRIPLMEDIEVSKRLRAVAGANFLPVRIPIQTSGVRWIVNGWWKTVLTMWWYRIRYFFGADPVSLYNDYYSPD